jgi:hypothetical protein
MPAQTNFPEFADGDVRIVITGSRQYKLHSTILKSVSPLMQELLTDDIAAPLCSTAIKKEKATLRFRLDLTRIPPDNTQKVPFIFDVVPLDKYAKPIVHKPIPLDLENGMIADPTFTVCADRLLRTQVAKVFSPFTGNSRRVRCPLPSPHRSR